jgi:Icc protein
MRVRDVATAASLARCLLHARQRHAAPDAILLTGDLAHDDAGGYSVLRACFADAGVPVLCLPGNHDAPAELRRHLADAPFVHDFASRHGAWLFVLLDSTVAGENHGHLSDAELARLDAALAANPDTHALVSLHHHPVPHGSRWLDELMLDNPDELFAVLARHRLVRGLAWGHTHQPFEGMHGHIRLMGTPSTCMQFAQDTDEFEVDARPPAYRWLELGDDGSLETTIEWVHADE